MFQPQAYIDFEVYEDGVNLLGVAKATPPSIEYLTESFTGAGFGGEIEAVLIGMVKSMTLGLQFRSVTDAAINLLAPRKHQLELWVAEQYWDNVQTDVDVQADKYVFVVLPKKTDPGEVAPATVPSVSGDYAVYRYEAYKDGKELWVIDPFNYICRIGGVDYMDKVRKALGK